MLTHAQDTIVPAGEAVPHHRLGQVLVAVTQGEFEAGLAGLANLEQGAARLVDIADADFIFRKVGDGEIFSHRAWAEMGRQLWEFQGPLGIVRGGIGIDGFLGTAMHCKVGA